MSLDIKQCLLASLDPPRIRYNEAQSLQLTLEVSRWNPRLLGKIAKSQRSFPEKLLHMNLQSFRLLVLMLDRLDEGLNAFAHVVPSVRLGDDGLSG